MKIQIKAFIKVHINVGNLFFFSPACKIEVPERLTASYEALVRNGLTDRCIPLPVREATDAEILLVHRSALIYHGISEYF